MATLAVLRSNVLRNLEREDADSTETGLVTDFINDVIREDLAQVHNWDFMEAQEDVSSVASQEDYSFPDSSSGELFKDCRFIRFRQTSTDDFYELEEVSAKALYQNFTEQTEGLPMVYARIGENKFRVRLIPDASTYTFRCHTWEYPAALSADGDTNRFTISYPRLVEFGATARGYLFLNELQSAQYWASMFANERDRAVKADRIRLAPNERTLKIGLAAGRPATGLRRGSRYRTSPFSWWTP